MAALAVLVSVSGAIASVKADTSDDDFHTAQDWFLVIDRAGILDQGQSQSAVNDAWRLTFDGIPTQVITENAALDQDQADARARELRISHGIESSRGADDGLLVYASVNPYDRGSVVMSLSAGTNTLPNNGLNAGSLQDVRESVMAFQLGEGRPARAIVYSLREIAYLEQYVPPAVGGLSGWISALHDILAFLSPTVALVGAAWLYMGRINGSLTGPKAIQALVVIGAAAIGLTILAVPGQSEIGIVSALALGVIVTWQAIVLDRQESRIGKRSVLVTPRPPGSRLRPSRSFRNTSR